MKPFLGIDLTMNKENEQINGQEFLIQIPSSDLSDLLENSKDKAEKKIEKAQLPFGFRVIKFICGIFALITIIGILRADVSFAEGYQNAPGLYWASGICLFVWMVLWIFARCKASTILETDESAQIFSHLEKVSDDIYRDLEVPVEAKEVDLLMFYYKEKNGDIKVCEKGMQIAQYLNPEFKVFTDNEYLYFANLEGKYAFPLSSIVNIHTVKKHIRIAGWNKDEEYNKGIYKQYKLTRDNYDCIHCKAYHILEIEHSGDVWGVFIPCYEWHVFEEIHEMFKSKKCDL
ncbi:MAG: hypothetical protein Q4D76_17165 [Oscillospiraceae bacterium]|nr:hypothetical protein [Oscillospiraceae bacterium]